MFVIGGTMGRRGLRMLLVLLVSVLLSAGAVCSVCWELGRALQGRFGAGLFVVGEWAPQSTPPCTSPLPLRPAMAWCGERSLLVLVGVERAEGLVLEGWVDAQNNTGLFCAKILVCGISITVYIHRIRYSTPLDRTPKAAGTAVVRSSSSVARIECCYIGWTPVEGGAGVCRCYRRRCRGGRRRRSTRFGWNTQGSQLEEGLSEKGEVRVGPLRILKVADPTPRVRNGGQNSSGGEEGARPVDAKTLLTVVGLVAAMSLLLAGLAVGGVVLCGALTIFSMYNKLARTSS